MSADSVSWFVHESIRVLIGPTLLAEDDSHWGRLTTGKPTVTGEDTFPRVLKARAVIWLCLEPPGDAGHRRSAMLMDRVAPSLVPLTVLCAPLMLNTTCPGLPPQYTSARQV